MIQLELEKIELYLQIVSELLHCVQLQIRSFKFENEDQDQIRTQEDELLYLRRHEKETSW
jgi:hypothetical protein